jgi:hypothetical protein
MNLLKQKIENFSTLLLGEYSKNFENIDALQASSECVEPVSQSFDKLIQLYEITGFLYSAKRKRIEPYMELIKKNWLAALQLDDQLMNIVQFKGNHPQKNQLTSISFWRTTNNSWIAQHLVSTGFPVGVCAMMLRAQAEVYIQRNRYHSFQNWFSKDNKYANLIFGTLVKTIGQEYSSVKLFQYMGVKAISKKLSNHIQIIPYQQEMQAELINLYDQIRGKIDSNAEELNHPDIGLEQLDQLYQKVNLRRKRYIWIATMKNKTQPLGAAIAYRGPFGLNFSLIENRCDLLINPNLQEKEKTIVIHNLLVEASKAYFEYQLNLPYPISYIPVVTDKRSANILERSGGTLLRQYKKSIWLQNAFEDWYKHIQTQYHSFLSSIKR